MIRLALGLALAASLLSWGLWQRSQAVQAGAELASLQTRLVAEQAYRQMAEEAAAIHRAHLERVARERAAWEKRANDLAAMGGQDEPLSDLLRAAVDSLWP